MGITRGRTAIDGFFKTTTDLINYAGKPKLDQIIETDGFTTVGDGGGAKWKATGNVIVTSQTPAQTGTGTCSDANGNEYTLVNVSVLDKAALNDGTAYRNLLNAKQYYGSAVGFNEIIKDSMPLNYVNTQAAFVVQNRDSNDLGVNSFSPGTIFQYRSTGNGAVNAGSELSQSIWRGSFVAASKTGDGSQHCNTATGQLGVVGVGGYNELGLYQGEATNTGSVLGTISGLEVLIKDSGDQGTTTFSTKMQAVVGRIAKYNPTNRKSYNFFASSEGALPLDAILSGNTAGLSSWKQGIDFSGLTFTTGRVAIFPNNAHLSWYDSSGSVKTSFFVTSNNQTLIPMIRDTSNVSITNGSFTKKFSVDNGGDSVLISVGGVLKRISEGFPDSGGVGFKQLKVAN